MMNRMMMMNGSNNATEEFSFPIISNNPLSNFMLSSSSASSSSLWRISSRIYHHQEDYEEDNYLMEVQSMCEEILPSNNIDEIVSFRSKELEVEEIMDYLWEDFDEEDRKEEIKGRKSIGGEISVMKVKKMMGSKGRNSNGNGNSRTKMVVIGKLLKGLVSIKKSAQLKLFKVESKTMRQGL